MQRKQLLENLNALLSSIEVKSTWLNGNKSLHEAIVKLIPYAKTYSSLKEIDLKNHSMDKITNAFFAADADTEQQVNRLTRTSAEDYFSVITERRDQLEEIALICAEWSHHLTITKGVKLEPTQVAKNLEGYVTTAIESCETRPFTKKFKNHRFTNGLTNKELLKDLKLVSEELKKWKQKLIEKESERKEVKTDTSPGQQSDLDRMDDISTFAKKNAEHAEQFRQASKKPRSKFKWKGLLLGAGIPTILTLIAVIITASLCQPAALAAVLYKVLIIGLSTMVGGATIGGIFENCCGQVERSKPRAAPKPLRGNREDEANSADEGSPLSASRQSTPEVMTALRPANGVKANGNAYPASSTITWNARHRTGSDSDGSVSPPLSPLREESKRDGHESSNGLGNGLRGKAKKAAGHSEKLANNTEDFRAGISRVLATAKARRL